MRQIKSQLTMFKIRRQCHATAASPAGWLIICWLIHQDIRDMGFHERLIAMMIHLPSPHRKTPTTMKAPTSLRATRAVKIFLRTMKMTLTSLFHRRTNLDVHAVEYKRMRLPVQGPFIQEEIICASCFGYHVTTNPRLLTHSPNTLDRALYVLFSQHAGQAICQMRVGPHIKYTKLPSLVRKSIAAKLKMYLDRLSNFQGLLSSVSRFVLLLSY